MRWILASLLVAGWVGAATAQTRTLTLVVPFPAGGSADVVARMLAENLRSRGTTAVVENRAGAGGTTGTASVARAPADGGTMLLGTIGSHLLAAASRTGLPYDPATAFEPVALLGFVPTLFVAGPRTGVTTLAEFIDMAERANPPLAYGSAGAGTSTHITVEMLRSFAGLTLTHVPYRGIAPALTDLIAGHIAAMSSEAPAVLPQIANGVRPLAILASRRSALVPEVPTAAELGFPDWTAESWYGLFVPAGVPEPVRAALEREVLEIVRLPHVAERLAASGLTGPAGSAEFRPFLAGEFERWPAAIRRIGVSVE
jgi:tripartite-type tricarboxylate transporter receptor subunit TctC